MDGLYTGQVKCVAIMVINDDSITSFSSDIRSNVYSKQPLDQKMGTNSFNENEGFH